MSDAVKSDVDKARAWLRSAPDYVEAKKHVRALLEAVKRRDDELATWEAGAPESVLFTCKWDKALTAPLPDPPKATGGAFARAAIRSLESLGEGVEMLPISESVWRLPVDGWCGTDEVE